MDSTATISSIPSIPYRAPEVTQFSSTRYAGFWLRTAAWLIDFVLLGAISSVISLIGFGGIIGSSISHGLHVHHSYYYYDSNTDFSNPAIAFSFVMMYLAYFILWIVGGWLYHALMESSSKQATIGKMAVGIKVTDLNGNRLTFARATARWFSRLISGMTFGIGYIMAGFTEKKQALHDLIASTLVVKGS